MYISHTLIHGRKSKAMIVVIFVLIIVIAHPIGPSVIGFAVGKVLRASAIGIDGVDVEIAVAVAGEDYFRAIG